jgi:hypothetical protein
MATTVDSRGRKFYKKQRPVVGCSVTAGGVGGGGGSGGGQNRYSLSTRTRYCLTERA